LQEILYDWAVFISGRRKSLTSIFLLYLEIKLHKSQEFLMLNASNLTYPDPVNTGNQYNANNRIQLRPENVFAE
jgi:hypothetical protein